MSGLRRYVWMVGTPFRFSVIGLIRLYRVSLSGMLGGQCRFYPSCSQYAEDAIRARGALVGSALAAWRLLRCNPWSAGGIDQPPGMYDDAIHRKIAA